MPLSKKRADELAAKLDLDVSTIGICHACLSFVSFAIDDGIPSKIAGETRRMTPDLWAEGLREPALVAVRRARDEGVRDADAALEELESLGSRSGVARAIVRRLAADLTRRTRIELRLEALARPRLSLAPPEQN
jgi:hypothetical protein